MKPRYMFEVSTDRQRSAPMSSRAAVAAIRATHPHTSDASAALILRAAIAECPHAVPYVGVNVRAVRGAE